jgi:DNA-binding CsgD family transcriptional regulator
MREVDQFTIIDGLIAAAYDAAEGAGNWDNFMAAAGTAFPHSKTAFCLFDRSVDHCPAFSSVNFDPEYLRSWEQYYSFTNPWIKMTEGNRWDFRWSDEYVSDDDLKRTEFYSGWVKPQGDISLGFAMNISNEADRTFLLSHTFRQRDRPAARQQLSIMRRVRPHLLRAYRLQSALGRAKAYADTLTSALDAVGHALMIVDFDCRVKFANKAADEMMSSGLLLTSAVSNSIRMKHTEDDDAIKSLARRMKIPREVSDLPFIELHSKDPRRFYALLAPVYHKRSESKLYEADAPPASLILLILDVHETGSDPAAVFRRLFGLAPAEARIAMAFCRGETIRDYAELHRIGYETARKQLLSVQDKVGVKRQAELMRLLTRITSLPIVRRKPVR